MLCPNCGEITYRSHSRNFRESVVKNVSPLRPYRCHDCGWRGYAAPPKMGLSRINRKVVFVWIAGVLLAVAVGYLGAMLNESSKPGPPSNVQSR